MKIGRWFSIYTSQRGREGYVHVGPVTQYWGENAMHWAINIRTPWGYFCARPTTRSFGNTKWPWYAYLSPNATPGSATWGVGPGFDGPRKVST